MNLVKRSFANIIDVINITFSCFLYLNDIDRYGLCATVHFSQLNFSSKITLYQKYFSNRFKISAAIISTIFPFIFTHIQPTLKIYIKKLNIFYSQYNQVTLSRHTFWHLYIVCSIVFVVFVHNCVSKCSLYVFTIIPPRLTDPCNFIIVLEQTTLLF